MMAERWISRYQPPSGCGSSPRRAIRSRALALAAEVFVGICRRNLRQIATWVTPRVGPDWSAVPMSRAMSRKGKWLIGLAAVVALLVAARIALPFIVEDYANRKLAALEAYDGHVGDIDIHLWRGAYSIDDIVIVKRGAKRPVPFFETRRLDLSVEWRSLLR